jgi:Protein of unknown function (DUF3043)
METRFITLIGAAIPSFFSPLQHTSAAAQNQLRRKSTDVADSCWFPAYDGQQGQSSRWSSPAAGPTVLGRASSGLRVSPRYAEDVFRRRSADAPELPDEAPQSSPAADEAAERASMTQGKGRPTPKRSEAERRRRQPYTAPADRKAAGQQSRDRDRTTRARRTEAMRRGENWALPRKDQGPVRALARDYVDSRRSISEYYMFGVLVLVALVFVPGLRKSPVLDYAVLVLLAVIVVESVITGGRVIKLANQRFPGENTRGVRLYAAFRGTQLRRLRMPAPRVKPGDKI